MSLGCFRSSFSQAEYDKHRHQFARFPTAWLQDRSNPLARFCIRDAGHGVVGLLPLLIHWANQGRKGFRLSQEEVSRLLGVSPEAISRARKWLDENGFVITTISSDRIGRRPFCHWHFNDSFKRCVSVGRSSGDYCYFPMSLIYGGHWSRMSHVAKATYLAAGLQTSTTQGSLADWWIVKDYIAEHHQQSDLDKCNEWAVALRAAAPSLRPGVRLALTSNVELAALTGLSSRAVQKYTRSVRAPSLGDADDAVANTIASPIWTYNAPEGQGIVVHLRDHVQPLPWTELNAGLTKKRVVT